MATIHAKNALVTGGSKGIGYGVAERLVREGVNVAITARTESEVKEAAKTLNDMGPGKAIGIVADARSYEDQDRAVADTINAFGSLDTLIANAGVGTFAKVDEMSAEDWHKVIDTNLTGVFYSVRTAAEEIKRQEGYIITISSLAGKNPFAGGSAYNASKFGLNGFSEAIMLDLRPHGVKVATIMPGSVATYFNDHTPSPEDAWKIQPEDIAELVYDLLVMNPRTLPSRVEVRPSMPPSARK